MLQGYFYYGTGNTGTDVTATIFDPILRAATTTVTIRGTKRAVKIMGISPCCDVLALGMKHAVIVGNSEPDYRKFDTIPLSECDTATTNTYINNYVDLGGYIVTEQETITITISDAATANHSGVLWVEDMEPQIPIPVGRPVTLRCQGAADAAVALATTGFTKDTAKLENGYLYTLWKAEVTTEDKLVEGVIIAAGKDSATLPNFGTMVFPHAPLQFTGEQWNAGQVAGYLQVQAATKVTVVLHLIETSTPAKSPNAPPIAVEPEEIPGVITSGGISGGGRSYTRSPTRNRYTGRSL